MLRIAFIMLRMFMLTLIIYLHYLSAYAVNEFTKNLMIFMYSFFTLATLIEFAFWFSSKQPPIYMENAVYFCGALLFAQNALINLQIFLTFADADVANIGVIKSHVCFITSLIYVFNFTYGFVIYTISMRNPPTPNFPPPVIMVMTPPRQETLS